MAGTKNLYTIKVSFSDDWCDLEKRITFKTDKFEMSVAILGMCETLPIPWEVFREPSIKLQVGAYGYKCNELALNTRWASLGRIWKGMLDSVCGCGHPTGPVQPSPKSFDILQAMIERKADRLTYEDEMLTLWSGDDPLSSFELELGSILPTGGVEGQVLAKASDKDGDYFWMTLPEVPEDPDIPDDPEPPKEPTININIPKGMIFLWFGPIDSIPSGYSLCDGQNGTVDLRDVFVIGAGNKFEPGDTNRLNTDDTVTTFSLLPDPEPEPEPTPDPDPKPDGSEILYYALAFIQKTSITAADVSGGLSAYEIAVENGYEGSETEWLASLQGKPGKDGKSAYEIAVENGFSGTLEEWTQQILSGSLLPVISDTAIDSVSTAPEQSGDYLFENVSLSTKGVTRTNFVSFSKNVVHLDITSTSIVVTMLSNERYVCELDLAKDIVAITHETLADQISANSSGGTGTPGLKGDKGDKGDQGDKGDKGDPGEKGEPGKSAYDIAVDHGFQGTEEEWLESLKGESNMYGKSAYEIAVEYGFVGTVPEWLESLKGAGGKSAYQIALDHGFVGTEAEWLESLKGSSTGGTKGEKGDKGDKGDPGLPGDNGASAYDIAVQHGFEGTESEWLESLKGSGIPTLTVIENKTIDSRKSMPEGGTGSYIFRNVVLASTKLSRSAAISGYKFPDDVVYVNMDYESQIIVDTLDNKHLVCILNGVGTITDIREEQLSGGSGDGAPGKSAYEIAVENGFTGTEKQWLASLKGDPGEKGLKGDAGTSGKSAYEVAKDNGFTGTESEWLESLKGKSLQAIPDFSTGELIAGRWIDDRPIYRQVIRASISTEDNEAVITTITGIKPIHMYGAIENQNGSSLYMIPGNYEALQYGLSYVEASGEVKLWSSDASAASKDLTLVIEYVKDNDDPLDDDELIVDPSISGGTKDHRELVNRDAQSQHPISAITGLQNTLDNVPTKSITDEELEELFK